MDELDITLKNGLRIIKFKDIKTKNSLSQDGYQILADTLNQDAKNEEVKITVITGTGSFFTSGNNLSKGLEKLERMGLQEILNEFTINFQNMVNAFIDYPKLIICVVNGPAIGIGVTICGLCDITYATDTATFQAPFVKLGLVIEACASYLLPLVLGKSKASEVLLTGQKMTADEALNFGFISKIISFNEVNSFIDSFKKLTEIPVESLILNKNLIRANFASKLRDCCNREIEQMKQCHESGLFLDNIMNFNKKSKL